VVFISDISSGILVNKRRIKEKDLIENKNIDPLIPAAGSKKIDAATKRGRIQMILLLLICASPVIASYFTFYVIKPQGGKTNIGQFVTPVQTLPANIIEPSLQGKWTLVLARPAANCQLPDDECVSLLRLMRQVKISTGKESQRVQLIWLVTDQDSIHPEVEKAYDMESSGFRTIRMPKDLEKREQLIEWLNLDGAGSAIHLLDPHTDRMMRFDTSNGTPDFKKFSKDLEKLLKWNVTGKAG
jgi:hypothetical protein